MLPLRTFPAVWVAASSDAEGLRLADELVSALNAQGPPRARRVTFEQLEPARAQGLIPAGTAVLRLVARFDERTDTRVSERPETICGPFGCYQQMHVVEYEVPVLEVRLEAIVHDGPSARELARLPLVWTEEGREYAVMRRRATAVLAQRLLRMIDPETTTLRARLIRISAPELESTFEAAARGELSRARRELTAFVASGAFNARDSRARAALLYDLAELWRFDEDAGEQAASRAHALLLRAVALDPRRLYDHALRDLADDERRSQTLEAQHAAAAHNFAIGERPRDAQALGAPTPPAGYR